MKALNITTSIGTSKMKTIHTERKFINTKKAGGNAYITADLNKEHGPGSKKKRDKYINYHIIIGDCYKRVELHGSLDTRKQRRQAIKKLQRLRKVILNLENAIGEL